MARALPIDDDDRSPLAGQPFDLRGTPRSPRVATVTPQSNTQDTLTPRRAIPADDDRFVGGTGQDAPTTPRNSLRGQARDIFRGGSREQQGAKGTSSQRQRPQGQRPQGQRPQGGELPPPGRPGTGIPPIDPRRFGDGGNSPNIIRQGLNTITRMFGLDRDASPNSPGVQAFARGEGAATHEQVRQIDQMTGLNQLEPHIRSIGRLDAMVSFHLSRGEPEKAQEAAAQLLLYSKRAAMAHGASIQALVERGDIPGAVRHAQKAYDEIPDGQQLEAEAGENGGVYRVLDRNGRLTEEGEFTTDTLLQLALGMQDGTAWFRMMSGAASEPMTENQRRGHELTERTLDIREREQRAAAEGTRASRGGAGASQDVSARFEQVFQDLESRAQEVQAMPEGPERDAAMQQLHGDGIEAQINFAYESAADGNQLDRHERAALQEAMQRFYDVQSEDGYGGQNPRYTAGRMRIAEQVMAGNSDIGYDGAIVVADILTDPEKAAALFVEEGPDGQITTSLGLTDDFRIDFGGLIGPVRLPARAYDSALNLAAPHLPQPAAAGSEQSRRTSRSNSSDASGDRRAPITRVVSDLYGRTQRALGDDRKREDWDIRESPAARTVRGLVGGAGTRRPSGSGPAAAPEEIPHYSREDAVHSISVPRRRNVDPDVEEALRRPRRQPDRPEEQPQYGREDAARAISVPRRR